MALETITRIAVDAPRLQVVSRTGTRTAADFDVQLGFVPRKVTVTNMTTGVSAEWRPEEDVPGMGNTAQRCVAAAGTITFEDGGLSMSGRTLSVVVATKDLESTNSVTVIEAN